MLAHRATCAVLAALVSSVILAQTGPSDNDTCVLRAAEDESRGTPVIFGPVVTVPELRFRFVDRVSGLNVKLRDVNVNYHWKWIQYPYPERDWGVWSDGRDWVECVTQMQSEVRVPPFTVKPRGWYDGKYAKFPWTKRLKFDRLEIVFEYGQCAPRLIVKSSDLQRFAGAIAVVQLPCAARAEVQFERKK